MATARGLAGAHHLGHLLAFESRRLLHHAQLSPGQMEELVPRLLLPQHALDLHILLRHGLDDHHHR